MDLPMYEFIQIAFSGFFMEKHFYTKPSDRCSFGANFDPWVFSGTKNRQQSKRKQLSPVNYHTNADWFSNDAL